MDKKVKPQGRFYKVYTIEKSLRHHVIEWAATVISIVGALLVSLRSYYGFYVFLVGDMFWMSFAIKHRHWGLFVTNIIFFILNIVGIYYWNATG